MVSKTALALEFKNGMVAEVVADDLAKRLAAKDSVIWIHAVASDPASLPEEVREIFNHCPLTFHDFHYGHPHPGIEQNRHALGFTVSFPGRERPTEYSHLGIYIGEGVLATITRKPSPMIEALRTGWIDDPEDVGIDAPSLLRSLLDAAIDEFYPALDDIHDRAELIEENLYKVKELDPTAPLAIKRELMVVRKKISPLRDNLNSLLRIGAPLIPASMHSQFSDLLSQCLRVTENADLGRDIVTSIMDAQLGMVSNRLNEVLRTLTVISTILMVCSLIAGIYGMNFTTMPELHWNLGYPFALGTMAFFAISIILIFRRKKWI